MSDANTLANRYIAAWNETDAERRRTLLQQGWTEDGSYLDPLMQGKGHGEIDALIGAVQARFPDFRFSLIGTPDGYGNQLRFSWQLGPQGADGPIKGTDFAIVKDGRLQQVTGFLDQIPTTA